MIKIIIFNQPIFPLTHTHVGISRVIAFEYVGLFEGYCKKKHILEGPHLEIQIGDQKVFSSNVNIVFLVSGRSQLSKNIFGYKSYTKNEGVFFYYIN